MLFVSHPKILHKLCLQFLLLDFTKRSELYQKHSEEIQLAKQPENSYVQGLLRLGILTARDSLGFLDAGVLTRGLSNISKPFLISPAISIYGGHFYIRFLPSVQWLLYLRHSMEKNKLNIKHKSVLYERLLSPF